MDKNRKGLFIAGAIGSMTNTIFVLGGIFFLFSSVFDGNIQAMLATVLGTNSIAEMMHFFCINCSACSNFTENSKINIRKSRESVIFLSKMVY